MKAQITLIIIIIIVLVIIAFGLYFIAFRSTTDQDLVSVTEFARDLESVENFLEQCSLAEAKKGLFLAGLQGGRLFLEQGGLKFDYPIESRGSLYVDYESKKVPYHIQLPVSAQGCSAVLPEYPADNLYPYTDSTLSSLSYTRNNCFGKKISFSLSDSLADLEHFVGARISECDLSSFVAFDFIRGNPSVDITTGTNTEIHVDYPLEIIDKQSKARAQLGEFTVTLDFSMVGLYDFVNALVDREISDPRFDIASSGGYVVNVVFDILSGDDLITVESDDLTIDSQPYQLRFLRRNRYPALEYVSEEGFMGVAFEEGNVINWEDVILGDLAAVDPDEDEVTLSVEMRADSTSPLEFTSDAAYTINAADIAHGRLVVRIKASDGHHIDYQDIVLQ